MKREAAIYHHHLTAEQIELRETVRASTLSEAATGAQADSLIACLVAEALAQDDTDIAVVWARAQCRIACIGVIS